MKKTTCVILLFAFISCNLSGTDLTKGWWKYGSGFWVGDVIDFKNLEIKNDTILKNNVPTFVLIKTEKGYFGKDDEIIIKDIKSNMTGKYHGK